MRAFSRSLIETSFWRARVNWYKEISPVERRTFKGCFSG
ncbi:major facilitator family transporter [Burkholderia mallei SAVP1]|nr:major facilitator family transporter [Burkholderia mallei SAVP1]